MVRQRELRRGHVRGPPAPPLLLLLVVVVRPHGLGEGEEGLVAVGPRLVALRPVLRARHDRAVLQALDELRDAHGLPLRGEEAPLRLRRGAQGHGLRRGRDDVERVAVHLGLAVRERAALHAPDLLELPGAHDDVAPVELVVDREGAAALGLERLRERVVRRVGDDLAAAEVVADVVVALVPVQRHAARGVPGLLVVGAQVVDVHALGRLQDARGALVVELGLAAAEALPPARLLLVAPLAVVAVGLRIGRRRRRRRRRGLLAAAAALLGGAHIAAFRRCSRSGVTIDFLACKCSHLVEIRWLRWRDVAAPSLRSVVVRSHRQKGVIARES